MLFDADDFVFIFMLAFGIGPTNLYLLCYCQKYCSIREKNERRTKKPFLFSYSIISRIYAHQISSNTHTFIYCLLYSHSLPTIIITVARAYTHSSTDSNNKHSTKRNEKNEMKPMVNFISKVQGAQFFFALYHFRTMHNT